MFVSRVFVGRTTKSSPGLRRPPPVNPNDPAGELYDTVVDRPSDPSIYVVFDNAQSYPEYCLELAYGSDPAVSAGHAEQQQQQQQQHKQTTLQLHVKYEAKNYAFRDERVQFIGHPMGGRLGGILLSERRPCAVSGHRRCEEKNTGSGLGILEACPLLPVESGNTFVVYR